VVNWVYTPAYNPKSNRAFINNLYEINMTVSNITSNRKYQNFIGIDISKKDFTVAIYGSGKVYSLSNNKAGFNKLLKIINNLSKVIVVLEATGGYESSLCEYLLDNNIPIHRSNPRNIKNFIRSFGTIIKTDPTDAKAISLYAKERSDNLCLLRKQDSILKKLSLLVSRREELVKMRSSEKNRLQSPGNEEIKDSIKRVLNYLSKEILIIEKELSLLVDSNEDLQVRQQILQSVPGIGEKTALFLMAKLPELGTIGNKQIAALTGLAPYNNDSGLKQGYRKTRGGRVSIKKSLFIAAMSVTKSNSRFGVSYRNAVGNGKKKMVALTALMRKLIVVANARIKQYINQKKVFVNN